MNRFLPRCSVWCIAASAFASFLSAAPANAEEACKGISTIQQLSDIRFKLDGCYFLTTDLNGANFVGFKPIGDKVHPITNPFRGTFDGRGHAIRNLKIYHNDFAEVGLFMRVAKTGVVRNLDLVDIDVRWTGFSSAWVGTVASSLRDKAVVTNVTVTGAVRGSDSSIIGGVIGEKDGGTLSKCSANVKVTGGDFTTVGGVLGRQVNGTTRECAAKGAVTAGQGSQAAGFAGTNINTNSKIIESSATGAVKGGEGATAAGFTTLNDGLLQQVYSHSPVTVGDGSVSLAALVTFANDTSRIIQAFATGKVKTTATFPTNIGGLIGFAAPGDVVTAGYWDTQSTGQNTSDGGTPRTTAQLKGPPLPAGFNGAVWGVNAASYPFLKKLQ